VSNVLLIIHLGQSQEDALGLTKPIAKAKLRRGNWNQDCINLDARRATKARKTQDKMEGKAERVKSEVEVLM